MGEGNSMRAFDADVKIECGLIIIIIILLLGIQYDGTINSKILYIVPIYT